MNKRESGFFQRMVEGEVKRYRGARFESTGAKNEVGKIIWRKLRKDGKPSNIFAEQFRPELPWLQEGKWFVQVDGGVILSRYPELKQDTEKALTMSHEEYCKALSEQYEKDMHIR